MTTLGWNPLYETGFAKVDEQHQHLFSLADQLSETLTDLSPDFAAVEDLLTKFSEYVSYHFEEEEHLMEFYHVDIRHVKQHQKLHKDFAKQLETLLQRYEHAIHLKQNYLTQILNFVVQWLVYHILGTDSDLAKQIKQIEHGAEPSEAYEELSTKVPPATFLLLETLTQLFEQINHQNLELMNLNHLLEQRVDERTEELSKMANHLKQLAYTDPLTQLPNRRHGIMPLA